MEQIARYEEPPRDEHSMVDMPAQPGELAAGQRNELPGTSAMFEMPTAKEEQKFRGHELP